MTIISKVYKQDQAKSHSCLQYSFTNIRAFPSGVIYLVRTQTFPKN